MLAAFQRRERGHHRCVVRFARKFADLGTTGMNHVFVCPRSPPPTPDYLLFIHPWLKYRDPVTEAIISELMRRNCVLLRRVSTCEPCPYLAIVSLREWKREIIFASFYFRNVKFYYVYNALNLSAATLGTSRDRSRSIRTFK